MTGRWVYRYEEQHRCRPDLDGKSRVGDIWQCECHKFWILLEEQTVGKYFAHAKRSDLEKVGIDPDTGVTSG